MTESVLKEIVHRAVRDGSFRAQLKSDPAGALAGSSLATEERSAIASGDPTRLTALGIDQRMSKAFATGVIGDASKVIVVDADPIGSGVFVDEGARAGSAVTGLEAEATRSPMWRIEQDLDAGSSLQATDDAPAEGTQVQDFNQDYPGDAHVTEY